MPQQAALDLDRPEYVTSQVREAIEQAVFEHAPDVVTVDILGLPDEESLRKPLPLVL